MYWPHVSYCWSAAINDNVKKLGENMRTLSAFNSMSTVHCGKALHEEELNLNLENTDYKSSLCRYVRILQLTLGVARTALEVTFNL